MNPFDPNSRAWDCFNPFSDEFKEAEVIFHDLVWWRQALVVSACVVGGLFFVVGAFPIFRWTVKALDPLENEAHQRVNGLYSKQLPRQDHGGARERPAELPNLQRQLQEARGGEIRAERRIRERGQTLHDFQIDPLVERNRGYESIKVYFIGDPLEEEQRLLYLATQYLHDGLYNFVGIHTMEMPLGADNPQLPGNWVHVFPDLYRRLVRNRDENSIVFGCTNQHIGQHNFSFRGSKHDACGLVSLEELWQQDPDPNVAFNKTLVRLMKLATYRVGLIKGIEPCVEYRCVMQNAMSVEELDRLPLTLCSQDMAKICHLTGRTLREGYEYQFDCLGTFNDAYGLVDFYLEIEQDLNYLREKLRNLPEYV